MVVILLSLFCNHDNLMLNLHKKNRHLDEECLFIGRFKVRSVPRMRNKRSVSPIYIKSG